MAFLFERPVCFFEPEPIYHQRSRRPSRIPNYQDMEYRNSFLDGLSSYQPYASEYNCPYYRPCGTLSRQWQGSIKRNHGSARRSFDESRIAKNLQDRDKKSVNNAENVTETKPSESQELPKFKLQIDVKGFKEDNLKIDVKKGNRSNRILTITGQKKDLDTDRVTKEFCKTYDIPDKVDYEKLESTLLPNGTLIVTGPIRTMEPFHIGFTTIQNADSKLQEKGTDQIEHKHDGNEEIKVTSMVVEESAKEVSGNNQMYIEQAKNKVENNQKVDEDTEKNDAFLEKLEENVEIKSVNGAYKATMKIPMNNMKPEDIHVKVIEEEYKIEIKIKNSVVKTLVFPRDADFDETKSSLNPKLEMLTISIPIMEAAE